MVKPARRLAPASLALRVMGTHKLIHHVKVLHQRIRISKSIVAIVAIINETRATMRVIIMVTSEAKASGLNIFAS